MTDQKSVPGRPQLADDATPDGPSAALSGLFFAGLRGFKPAWIRSDLSAGLAIAAVALPSAVAYPAIAGLPPETGLYASIFSLIGYAIIGPSRLLMVGPDAASMTVLAAVLAQVPAADTAGRVAAASALALCVGVMCLVGNRLRLGVVAAFLSRPILIGFISGIAISLIIGQIGRFTGLKIESDGLVRPILELSAKLGMVHWPSVALAVGAFIILRAAAALKLAIPGPLIVVVLAIALAHAVDLSALGIRPVGALPSSFPRPSLPFGEGLPFVEVLLGGAAIWLVSFASGLVAARSFGSKVGARIDADAELLGIGGANLAAGLFQGFPVTVSDSRTAIHIAAGGRSQLAGLVAALALSAGMLFLNGSLEILPVPVLGAILVSAALGLIDLQGLMSVWRVSRLEFVFALIGMWGAISLGVLNGVVIAVGATLLYVLLKEMRPHDALLGRSPGRDGFYKLHRVATARQVPGLAIYLLQGSLLFFNADFVRERIEAVSGELAVPTRWFVIDASAIAQIDTTAATVLEEVLALLKARGMTLVIAELHNEPRIVLERSGFLARLGPDRLFDTVEDAYAAFMRQES